MYICDVFGCVYVYCIWVCSLYMWCISVCLYAGVFVRMKMWMFVYMWVYLCICECVWGWEYVGMFLRMKISGCVCENMWECFVCTGFSRTCTAQFITISLSVCLSGRQSENKRVCLWEYVGVFVRISGCVLYLNRLPAASVSIASSCLLSRRLNSMAATCWLASAAVSNYRK